MFLVICIKQYNSSIWFLLLTLESAAQIAEGWHSMAHGLFITDKVTVGVVASVCQCPSAPNPLTVSLAQVLGTALPYDKHSLVEGSWTRARHPKEKRQWTEQLLDLDLVWHVSFYFLIDYYKYYAFTDIVLMWQRNSYRFCNSVYCCYWHNNYTRYL